MVENLSVQDSNVTTFGSRLGNVFLSGLLDLSRLSFLSWRDDGKRLSWGGELHPAGRFRRRNTANAQLAMLISPNFGFRRAPFCCCWPGEGSVSNTDN